MLVGFPWAVSIASHGGPHPSPEPRQARTGMFTYMADAAVVQLCADGARLPVAMEGDYQALEAAYWRR
jgi:NlpE C-terminal OB domain